MRVPYNDIESIRQIAQHNQDVVAVLTEVVQGEGGIHVARVEYLRALRQLCDEKQWLLMIDEVQSGMGRTGRWFAHQHSGIQPDVMPLAKGLGSGVPIGACLARGTAARLFKPGNHGTTLGGGPLVSVAALTTLNVMEEEGLLAHAERMGKMLRDGFSEGLAGIKEVVEIRGQGLMLGIELVKDRQTKEPAPEATAQLLEGTREHGLLIGKGGLYNNVIRLSPMLNISKADVDDAARILDQSFAEIQL